MIRPGSLLPTGVSPTQIDPVSKHGQFSIDPDLGMSKMGLFIMLNMLRTVDRSRVGELEQKPATSVTMHHHNGARESGKTDGVPQG